jgi:hypothetical protein
MFIREYGRHLLWQAMQFVNMGCLQVYPPSQKTTGMPVDVRSSVCDVKATIIA